VADDEEGNGEGGKRDGNGDKETNSDNTGFTIKKSFAFEHG
jgi:hypothetical protein